MAQHLNNLWEFVCILSIFNSSTLVKRFTPKKKKTLVKRKIFVLTLNFKFQTHIFSKSFCSVFISATYPMSFAALTCPFEPKKSNWTPSLKSKHWIGFTLKYKKVHLRWTQIRFLSLSISPTSQLVLRSFCDWPFNTAVLRFER